MVSRSVSDERYLGVALILATFSIPFCLGYLPITLYLKDQLHIGPTVLAAFVGAGNMPWYFKPVAAFVSDKHAGSFGRKPVILGSWLLAGLCCLLLPIVGVQYWPLFWLIVAINAFLTVAAGGLNGVMGDISKRFSNPGRISSVRSISLGLAGLIAAPIGGWLATKSLTWTAWLSGIPLLALVAMSLRAPALAKKSETRENRSWLELLKGAAGARDLWKGTVALVLLSFAPSFGMPLLFFQTDVLKLSPQFLGNLGLIGQLVGLAAAFMYASICRKWPLRKTLYLGVSLHALGAFAFALYKSPISAVLITIEYSFVSAFAAIPFMDLALRSAPTELAGMGLALITAIIEVMVTLSAVAGAWLYERFHLTLAQLAAINGSLSLLGLAFLPFISAAVLSRPDGVQAPTGETA